MPRGNTPRASLLAAATAAALAGVSLQAAPAPADTPPIFPDRARESGWAVLAGAGHDLGGLGLHLAYFHTMGQTRFQVAPHLGGGLFLGATRKPSPAVGISVRRGGRHRTVIDLSGGAVGIEDLVIHGTRIDQRLVYGLVVMAGYELVTMGGFLFHAMFGGAYPLDPRLDPPLRQVAPSFSLALGRRF